MNELLQTVDWSRFTFALTACYHWLFVPLTLGLAVIIGVMETIYVMRRRDERWLAITKFWMSLFAINFVCGVATGIILEFEFGTNWSNYSWFVGDIFGAPLAIEGLLAFFMESTFFVVMLFGWKRVGPRFHLAATWLTALGASISALWILVANAWMQYPVGMTFNPDTMRNEMTDFIAVAFSPVAINKLFHTLMSGWALAGCFVVGVSAWIAVWGKNKREMVIPSVKVGGWVGLIGLVLTMAAGHGSAVDVGRVQPMKLAAMEGLWEGGRGVELVGIGILNPAKRYNNNVDPFLFKVGLPNMLSWVARGDKDAFIPGIQDIIAGRDSIGNEAVNTVSYSERIARGQKALAALADYGTTHSPEAKRTLMADYPFFGYGYSTDIEYYIPPVALSFYAFHAMVAGGMYMGLILVVGLLLAYLRPTLMRNKAWGVAALIGIAVAWITSQSGWICAEVGRQPWVVQDLMPTQAAITAASASGIKLSFWAFATVFTGLLIAEISILIRKIKA